MTIDQDEGKWVITVVDAVKQPWPKPEELIGLGVPEDVARAWVLVRYRMSRKCLALIMEESRN